MRIRTGVLLGCACFLWIDPGCELRAQDGGTGDDQARRKRYEKFEQTMSGVRLVGRFTVLGKEEGPLREEEYVITSVKKAGEGDYWLFQARIKYGQHDVTLPLPLEVKWAGDTPIITLTNVGIPGLGVFSSRVVIYNNKYAGTWTHGEAGGHMFGVLKPLKDSQTPSSVPETK